ncbi:hypothetical protein HER32_09780 [Hymenobacter sp. BT18]|uniref:carboxypeptidase-like regulatory domain-containing protein n=1 Tax=Hymenobacter sp. BT18 TaxID=2835648 RepID=UPI00143EB66A|nr:carboxypeptidase-like regulatory domain-containing protein [Hymenobacter sp. BT18]QIX61452.1 hypothetical protein HER32_09780 [Hymenobacter sp. BT18]
MALTAAGRFCGSCQHEVVDFTRMTDAELLAFLQGQTSGCGRFRADQVRPTLRQHRRAWHLWAAAVAWVGSVLVVPRPAFSQQAVQVSPSWQPVASVQPKRLIHPEHDARILRGAVVDSLRNPLPCVTVLLKGTLVGTLTDDTGQFELALPESSSAVEYITVTYIGYQPQSLPATQFLQADAVVILYADWVIMKDSTVTGGYCAFPHWYTPRGVWWRVTQLFRR